MNKVTFTITYSYAFIL